MNEYRCKFCHKLLLKETNSGVVPGKSIIEIKCGKCKKINKITIPHHLDTSRLEVTK